MSDEEVEKIAKGLTEAQRAMAVALCGNAWRGWKMSPGIAIMNGLGLIHIDALKDAGGTLLRFKARPTELGTAVRNYLTKENEGDRPYQGASGGA